MMTNITVARSIKSFVHCGSDGEQL